LASHPQKQSLVLTLLPLAKEVINNSNDLVIDHADLKKYISELEQEFGLTFDLSAFEKMTIPDTWHF